jgi:hypothetical protein
MTFRCTGPGRAAGLQLLTYMVTHGERVVLNEELMDEV